MFADTFSKNFTLGMNDAVKAFVASEILLWAAWNFIIPIFSVMVVDQIEGGTIQLAAYAYTTYLVFRMIFELIVSNRISQFSTAQRAILDIFGMTLLSLAYIGLAVWPSISMVFAFYVTVGIGFGVASPAKNSLFSSNLERETEARVWGIYDVSILSGMAIATSLGGIIAANWGFSNLLLFAAVINIIGVTPYLRFIRAWRKRRRANLMAVSQDS